MKIYVSNLSFDVQDKDLKNFFTGYGEVTSATIITDRETNRSRGFGFVEMTNEEASQKAITALNGSIQNGRTINVSPATERSSKPKTNFNNSRSYNKNRY